MTKSDSLIVLYGRRAARIQALATPVIRAGGEQMHGADGPLHEGALAVTQVVIPHSAEAFVEAQFTDARQRADKSGPPVLDGFAVMGADVFQPHRHQPGVLAQRLAHHRH